ncbi:MAG: NERD domain-containing protein [Chloroflexi bacterium]|nr:MAG: NERD domain-containing protein [Chloroflexota bacterium]
MPIRHYLSNDPVNTSEHVVVQHLLASAHGTGDRLVLSNVGLPDRGHAWPGDIDIVLIGSDTVHCLEVKPWETNFLANPDNRSMIEDARRRTKAKSGYLHELITRQFPHLKHRATILVSNTGITPPRSVRHFDGPPGASDIIGIHRCARLFDADARPALTPGELDAIARLVDAGFDPSRCLISGPPESTTGPTRVVRHLRGRPVTPYLPPALVVPSATASSAVQPVTQVVSRPKRKRKAGTDDTSRKLEPRGAPIVGPHHPTPSPRYLYARSSQSRAHLAHTSKAPLRMENHP